MRRGMFAAALLFGCEEVGPADDVGTVVVTCTYSYAFPDGVETGEYPGFTTDCAGWADHGYQALNSVWSSCEEDGLAAGADSATCECSEDTGTCTFPHGVND